MDRSMPASTAGLGFLVADVSRMMRRAFQARFEGSPLTYAQARALVYLSRQQGIRQVDLAEQLEVQPITLARLVDQLAAAGLVERRPDPADRRVHRLHLNRAAEPQLASILQVVAEVRAEAVAGLGDAEAARLVAGLQRVRANLAASRDAGRDPARDTTPAARGA
jgi:DNA-binding MarR family transcriptional regulator